MTKAEHIIRIAGRSGIHRGASARMLHFQEPDRMKYMNDEYETEMRSMFLRTSGQGRKPRTGGKPVEQAAPFREFASKRNNLPASSAATLASVSEQGAVPARRKDRLFNVVKMRAGKKK